MKVTHTKETNKEDKDETMNTSYNKEEDKDEGITLDSKPSTPDPPNLGQVIGRYDEMDKTGKPLEDYYGANIDHNHPNFLMIREIVKEERKVLRASIYLLKKSKLPYSSTNYLFTTKVPGPEMRQRNNKDIAEQYTPSSQ